MALAATPGGGSLGQQPQLLRADNNSDGRRTLCISNPPPADHVLQHGEPGFAEQVARFYTPEETAAADRLVDLKIQLETTTGDDFWTTATEGMAKITGAQYAFISKRMEFNEDDPNSSLPPLGEPDSCLLGLSIYYCGGDSDGFNAKRTKYIAYNSPCAHMKHNKVLLIPERLSEVVHDNPNGLPEQPEGYLAVPLSTAYSSPKVFGHFGVMWSEKGVAERSLSFPFMEMILHSLEDIIISQFFEQGLVMEANSVSEPLPSVAQVPEPAKVYASFSTSSSLKPYARSLSHELRTPMQGVVGMLDVMFAQVQEAGEGQVDPKIHELFTSLKESIEVVQDSARRAVEAADNIVHAYDMNMSVPEAPVGPIVDLDMEDALPINERSTGVLPTPIDSESPVRGHKRGRSSADTGTGHISKSRRIASRDESTVMGTPRKDGEDMNSQSAQEGTPSSHTLLDRNVAPVPRATNVRDALQSLVNDVINLGGRPISAIAEPVDGGEEIEVRRKTASGEEKVQLVKWSIDSMVPDTIVVDERDFAGLISRVLHNALKFTESGKITVAVRISSRGGYIVISVEDTGIGIPSAFMPKLFRPFSKEDDGITRQSEGLGLGLMVAKGLARRLNGDLYAVRSETDGPSKGTEFQMRIPVTPGDSVSRPSTPYGSPSPGSRLRSAEEDLRLGETNKTRSPPYLSSIPISRHSRSSSNATRFGQCTNSLPQAVTAAYAEHVTTLLEVPRSYFPPPDIITPPISIGTDHPSGTAMLRMNSCVLPNSRPDHGKLATRLPLSFLVVEDNTVLRKILVRMLHDMGYTIILEAYDGVDAVRQMERHRQQMQSGEVTFNIDVVLMDLWMPTMNGYQAAEKIVNLYDDENDCKAPMILAVTADTTDEATERVARAGMKGPLTKPYKSRDLERNLLELGIWGHD
jgi:signal transduction histidine kinase/AmiR/NasT family two-component response regulator